MTIAELGCGVSTACVEKHSIINIKKQYRSWELCLPPSRVEQKPTAKSVCI